MIAPGRTIGRYEIRRQIGRGGMAAVYQAWDPRFGREVAIKVLPRELLHDESFRARFDREARTIAALEHAAIVPVYDYGEDGGQPYLVMRYMAGGSLADRIRRQALELGESAALVARIAQALDYAHQKGVIHRDLKPANILFDAAGAPYLADFGIARLAQATTTTLTGAGIIGTPAYMSPEQGRGEREIDGRSDIYALGAILYEMLAGRVPFEAETPTGQIIRHMTEPVPELRLLRPDLPSDLQPLLRMAMAKDRRERFASGAALARALVQIAEQSGQLAQGEVVFATPRPPPLSLPAQHAGATPAAEARRRGLLLLGLQTGLLLLTAGCWFIASLAKLGSSLNIAFLLMAAAQLAWAGYVLYKYFLRGDA